MGVFIVLGAVYIGVLGACLASFGCVVSERVPAGVSIMGRSRCACGRQLRVSENIPVLGWLRTRGVTRCCGVHLPVRYVAWEVGYGVWGAVMGAVAAAGFVEGAYWVTALAGSGFITLFPFLLAATWQRPGE